MHNWPSCCERADGVRRTTRRPQRASPADVDRGSSPSSAFLAEMKTNSVLALREEGGGFLRFLALLEEAASSPRAELACHALTLFIED